MDMTEVNEKHKVGAERYIAHFPLESGQRVVIVTDEETKALADLLAQAASKKGLEVAMFVMEEFGERPLQEFPAELSDVLEGANASIFVAEALGEELPKFRMPFLTKVKELDLFHGHSPGFNLKMLETGVMADPQMLGEFTQRITAIVEEETYCHVTNEAGTDLHVILNPNWNWEQDAGMLKSGTIQNIPRGETFTTPLRIDGLLAATGSIGDKWTGLLKHPLYIKIENSRVVKILSEDTALVTELWNYFRSGENGDRVGEFALATNLWIGGELIGALLQDEKAELHIAFGHSYSDDTGADWDCGSGHLDILVVKPTVVFGAEDNQPIMVDGRWHDELLPEEFAEAGYLWANCPISE